MESSFSGANLKLLNAALGCLGRFGDQLSFFSQPKVPSQGQDAYMRLSVINPSFSAICQVFLDPQFFTTVTHESDDLKPSALNAKLPMRTLQACLRNRASGKRLVSCELNAVVEEDTAKMVVVLKYVQHLVITHDLTYEPEAGLVPVAEAGPHSICLSHGTAKSWLHHFLAVPTSAGPNAVQSTKVGEVTLYCTDQSCELMVKHEEVPTSISKSRDLNVPTKTGITTTVAMDHETFTKFQVSREELLTFPLKEFKAGLTLADQLLMGIELRFGMGGDPLFLVIRHLSGVRATLVLATSSYSVMELEPGRTNPNVPGRKRPAPRATPLSTQADQDQSSIFGRNTHEASAAASLVMPGEYPNKSPRRTAPTYSRSSSANPPSYMLPHTPSDLPQAAGTQVTRSYDPTPTPLASSLAALRQQSAPHESTPLQARATTRERRLNPQAETIVQDLQSTRDDEPLFLGSSQQGPRQSPQIEAEPGPWFADDPNYRPEPSSPMDSPFAPKPSKRARTEERTPTADQHDQLRVPSTSRHSLLPPPQPPAEVPPLQTPQPLDESPAPAVELEEREYSPGPSSLPSETPALAPAALASAPDQQDGALLNVDLGPNQLEAVITAPHRPRPRPRPRAARMGRVEASGSRSGFSHGTAGTSAAMGLGSIANPPTLENGYTDYRNSQYSGPNRTDSGADRAQVSVRPAFVPSSSPAGPEDELLDGNDSDATRPEENSNRVEDLPEPPPLVGPEAESMEIAQAAAQAGPLWSDEETEEDQAGGPTDENGEPMDFDYSEAAESMLGPTPLSHPYVPYFGDK